MRATILCSSSRVRFYGLKRLTASGSLAKLWLGENNIGTEGAKAIADAVAASGSLALKKLVVPNRILKHAELVAACRSKGVALS